jgi:hybrid cluster-associated redox disulfide protein
MPLVDRPFFDREQLRRRMDACPCAKFAPAQRRMAWPRYCGSMGQEARLTADVMVDEVMQRWPATIRIFLDFRMGCIGCPIAAFHSVEQACREHNVDLAAFLAQLRDTASVSGPSRSGLRQA